MVQSSLLSSEERALNFRGLYHLGVIILVMHLTATIGVFFFFFFCFCLTCYFYWLFSLFLFFFFFLLIILMLFFFLPLFLFLRLLFSLSLSLCSPCFILGNHKLSSDSGKSHQVCIQERFIYLYIYTYLNHNLFLDTAFWFVFLLEILVLCQTSVNGSVFGELYVCCFFFFL